jgi:hypothetical protein
MRLAMLAACAVLLGGAPVARAQSAADSAAIRATALDYIEGWWTGNAERMERALHGKLAKRMVVTDSTGHSRLVDMTALELVQNVRAGGGTRTPAPEQRSDVTILDTFRNAAIVKIDAGAWIDYLQEAKWNGRWVIVNVLWELRPRQ